MRGPQLLQWQGYGKDIEDYEITFVDAFGGAGLGRLFSSAW